MEGMYMLNQHFIRTLPHPYFCPFCMRPVTKYHQHWGDRFKWKAGQQ